ncbi:MAG: hypothetical protein PHU85_07345 [Phycisphaerae bacterium]|nr:hypothetical protein [Phycisphaerae bacterium]
MMRSAVVLAATLMIGCQTPAGPKDTAPSVGVKAGAPVRIEAESFATITKAVVKDFKDASGGKAVVFDRDTSAIETVVAVPPGKYKIVAVGMAVDYVELQPE